MGLVGNYLRALLGFRAQDLERFVEEHERLFTEARRTGDHREVTQAYYRVMGPLIETYYGAGWHFCPPEHPKQSQDEAVLSLHHRISRLLGARPGLRVLDVGSGVGGTMRDIALYSGCHVTGITLGDNEVESAREAAAEAGLTGLCEAVQGDSLNMPFEDASFDSAYAVYALKYYPKLDRVLSEIHRVLKPEGLFAAYCLGRTDGYDPENSEDARIVADFEYATGMPPLPTPSQVTDAAERVGLRVLSRMDLSQRWTWYHYWTRNPLLPWLVSSRLIRGLIRLGEWLRILPRGFGRFNDIFLSGTVRLLIEGGRRGVLSGSTLLVFAKPNSSPEDGEVHDHDAHRA